MLKANKKALKEHDIMDGCYILGILGAVSLWDTFV